MNDEDMGNLTDDEELFQLPKNRNNSCFLDSLLVSLFWDNNVFLDFCFLHRVLTIEQTPTKWVFGTDGNIDLNYRNKVQENLLIFVRSMRKIVPRISNTTHAIKNLRVLLSDCKSFPTFQNKTAQQEAMECLYAILDILQFDSNFNLLSTQVFGTNDLLSLKPQDCVCTVSRIEKVSCVHRVGQWNNNDTLTMLLHDRLDSGILKQPVKYARMITLIEYRPIQIFFILHFDRGGSSGQNPLCLQETISIEGQNFDIKSIMMHERNHYRCLLKMKLDGQWMLYDDVLPQTVIFKSFVDAIAETNADKQCTFVLLSKV